MDNLKALSSLCNAIANTFYPDHSTIVIVLINEGIDPQEEATPKDETLFRLAIRLVMGYVESSRSENGVSTSVREDAIKESIKYWCNIYGLDAEDFIPESLRIIEDGSKLW